jgi:hypothetical protein
MVPSAETSMQQPAWNAGPKGLAADRRLSARRRLGDVGQHRARQIHQHQRVAEQERLSSDRACLLRCDLDHDIFQSAPFAEADSPTPAGARLTRSE